MAIETATFDKNELMKGLKNDISTVCKVPMNFDPNKDVMSSESIIDEVTKEVDFKEKMYKKVTEKYIIKAAINDSLINCILNELPEKTLLKFLKINIDGNIEK